MTGGALSGEVAVVTGGAGGIGAAVAAAFAREGARVAVADLDQDAAQVVASGLGDHHLALSLDVRESASDPFGRADGGRSTRPTEHPCLTGRACSG